VRIVDCDVQLQTRTYFEAHVGRSDPPFAERDGDGYVFVAASGASTAIPRRLYDPELQLEELADQGVDVAVSTTGSFTVDHLPRRQATELAMHLNEERAELERRFAGRFYALALLPMQDAQSAIETLEHAIRTLGMRAVAISAEGVKWSTSASQAPVFRRVAELGVPLFLQPAPGATAMDVLGANEALTVVHPGAGDGLPCLAVSAAQKPDRLLFASGYPDGSAADGIDALRGSLAEAELRAALSENATSLLGLR
jgi:predicted TIM-barrel fold metal-dependent hydrolase